jgi:hypothetical protein
MGRRRFNLGRLIGQVIGWSCFIVGILDAVIHHHP